MSEELSIVHGKGDFVRVLTDVLEASPELAVRMVGEYALRGREEIDNVNLTVKSLDREDEVIAGRIKPLQEARNALKRIRELIRRGIIAAADEQGEGDFPGFKTDGILAYISGEHVVVEDEELVPEKFIREVVVREVDKRAVLAYWKATGTLPAGCRVESTPAVRFKNRA